MSVYSAVYLHISYVSITALLLVCVDRKAIVSKGRVKCVGSSLFLKNRFGLGYHLGYVHTPILARVCTLMCCTLLCDIFIFLLLLIAVLYGECCSLETTNDAVVADVTNVVRSHVPNASPARVHGNEMTFTLPLDNVGQFSGGVLCGFYSLRALMPNAQLTLYYFQKSVEWLAYWYLCAGLFKTLENLKASNSKGIAGFGIAMTTLEEVFLQIGEMLTTTH